MVAEQFGDGEPPRGRQLSRRCATQEMKMVPSTCATPIASETAAMPAHARDSSRHRPDGHPQSAVKAERRGQVVAQTVINARNEVNRRVECGNGRCAMAARRRPTPRIGRRGGTTNAAKSREAKKSRPRNRTGFWIWPAPHPPSGFGGHPHRIREGGCSRLNRKIFG